MKLYKVHVSGVCASFQADAGVRRVRINSSGHGYGPAVQEYLYMGHIEYYIHMPRTGEAAGGAAPGKIVLGKFLREAGIAGVGPVKIEHSVFDFYGEGLACGAGESGAAVSVSIQSDSKYFRSNHILIPEIPETADTGAKADRRGEKPPAGGSLFKFQLSGQGHGSAVVGGGGEGRIFPVARPSD